MAQDPASGITETEGWQDNAELSTEWGEWNNAFHKELKKALSAQAEQAKLGTQMDLVNQIIQQGTLPLAQGIMGNNQGMDPGGSAANGLMGATQQYTTHGGGGCCFIFAAAGPLHPVVRRYRDEHMTTRNRRGYCWLADRLVPMMESSPVVLWLVRRLMTDPMTRFGEWYYGQSKTGWLCAPFTAFWMAVYNVLGMRGPYRRRGTDEVV